MRNLIAKMSIAILSSSVVERSAVNRLVVGSNPTWGVFKLILWLSQSLPGQIFNNDATTPHGLKKGVIPVARQNLLEEFGGAIAGSIVH
jgi:hypothetical protein